MPTAPPDPIDDDDEEEEEEDEEPARPAPKPPAAQKKPGPPSPYMPSPRTLRGVMVTVGITAFVLFFYQVIRPFCARHDIPTFVDEDVASALKGVLAISAICFSVWALIRRLAGKPFAKKQIAIATMVFGGLGIGAWVVADDLGATNFIHKWEFFHYYLGSKYPEELGYKRLYLCAAIAQAELGPAMKEEVIARNIRDLETDTMTQAAPVLEHPEICKRHFTAPRWRDFKRDINWFRHSSNQKFWEGMSTDHGYNPPPVWTMSGHLFGMLVPHANTSGMTMLASIDVFFFAFSFFFIWWAFGLEVCAAALVYWGTQFPANGYFTGGAFLRHDWLFYLILAACLLRKHYWAGAGAALAASTLLRVFPAFFFVGIAVVAATYFLKHRRLATHHMRFFAGAAVGTVVLVAASVAIAGPKSYEGFYEHIQVHNRAPLTNNMGLPILLSFTQAGRAEHTRDPNALDEFGKWGELRTRAFTARKPAFLLLNAFIGFVFVLTLRKIKTLWIAMALSGVLICSVLSLTCYYYCFFILAALLTKVSQDAGRLTLLAAGVSSFLIDWSRVSYQWDDRFTAQSLVFLAFSFVMLLSFMVEPKKKTVAAAPDAAKPKAALPS